MTVRFHPPGIRTLGSLRYPPPEAAPFHTLVHSSSVPTWLSTVRLPLLLASDPSSQAGDMERPSPAGPLVVSGDAGLVADLMRLCAAASVTPQLVDDPGQARSVWWRASCVLVGADRADAVANLAPGRRDGVVLVAREPESVDVWRLAMAVRAERLALLPTAQTWLVELLTDTVDGSGGRAATVAVIGGRGGAGASTLAACLALRAAKSGLSALLVDADPLGGGIELLLGCESAHGLRWPEVAATQGRVSAAALREALPDVDGVAVLSCGRAEPSSVDPVTMRVMLGAAQRGSDLVLVDVPRRLDEAAMEAVVVADTVLLLCTGDVRVAASAERQLIMLRLLCGDIRLVVRRTQGADVLAADLASILELPLAGEISTQRGLDRCVNEGLGPLVRGQFGAQCARLLATVLPSPAIAP